jgi:metallo-beta-lactamase family protein
MIDENTDFVRTADETIELNSVRYPCATISASGKASGGSGLHHLKTLLPNPRNCIVCARFQAPGTRENELVNGAESEKIHGEHWPVKVETHNLDSLSAHGYFEEILNWIVKGPLKPEKAYITHGEVVTSEVMGRRIRDHLGEMNIKRKYSWQK